MGKIKIIFLAICILTGLSWIDTNSRDLIEINGKKVVDIARSQVGIKEKTNNNDGPEIKEYLNYTNLTEGYSWCASFVSWVHWKSGLANPRTAWSPSLFPAHKIAKSAKSGFVYGIYDYKQKRINHCGIVDKKSSDWVIGIEGNTNLSGSANGNGVFIKRRHIKTIHAIANWLN